MDLNNCKPKGMYIIHLNARSLNSNFSLIKPLIENNSIDICTISETWLHDLIPNTFVNIPGYTIIRQDRILPDRTKRGGGLVMYISNRIEHYINRPDLNYCDQNIEMQWIEIHIPNQKKYFIGNIYRPPNTNSTEALSKLNITFEKLKEISRSEIFCLGDFNIDMSKPSKDRKDLYEILSENGLEQLIKKTTRQTIKTKTILDLIITNSDCVLVSGILYNNISDHYQVYLIRKHIKKQKQPTQFVGRNYSNYNKEILENALDQIDWTNFISENEPNLMLSIYLENILIHINKLYPIRKFNINQQKEPWINDELMHIIIEKDRLLSQAKLLNSDDAWERAKQAKNRTKNYIQRAKSNYISDTLELNKQNPRTFWKSINGLLPNKKNSDNNILLKDQTTNNFIPENDTPDFINTFFTSIGPKLAQNYKKSYETIGPIGQEEFDFNRLTDQEVRKEFTK